MQLTDEQIKQALEFCGNCECNDEKTEKECALITMSFCKNYLRKQSLDYINRLETENSRLQAQIDFVISSKNLAEAAAETKKAELDLAKAFHREAVAERDLLSIQLKEAKAELEALTAIEEKENQHCKNVCEPNHREEIERLKEKTRNVFTGVINKFLSLEDLYVIVEDEFVPWEPTEEVEHLFKMSISGDTEENVREIDRVIKELVGDSDE